jgi:hypothetical protein
MKSEASPSSALQHGDGAPLSTLDDVKVCLLDVHQIAHGRRREPRRWPSPQKSDDDGTAGNDDANPMSQVAMDSSPEEVGRYSARG